MRRKHIWWALWIYAVMSAILFWHTGSRAFSQRQSIRPFDRSADGTLPGEGAAALVIKRLDRAIADGDRVYAVIKGIGSASGGGIDTNLPSKEAYVRSLKRCCREAGMAPSAISFMETHGSGDPAEDNLESLALHEFIGNQNSPCAIGSTKANIGHTGAAAALGFRGQNRIKPLS